LTLIEVKKMKCMSCEAKIPSEWKSAIQNNSCPACGGQIMTDEVKSVSDNLSAVIGQLINLGEEPMDLLLDSVGLIRKPLLGQGNVRMQNNELPANFKIADNSVQDFLSRTNSSHLNRRDTVKNILSRVNNANDDNMVTDYVDDYEAIPQDYQSTARDALVNNSMTTGGVPPTSEETALLMQALGDNNNLSETDQIHPALYKQRMKRLAKSREVANGGGGGGKYRFSRSG